MRRKSKPVNGKIMVQSNEAYLETSNWFPTNPNATDEYNRSMQIAGNLGTTWLPFGADGTDQPVATLNSTYISRMTGELAVISAAVDRTGYDPGIGPVEIRRYMNRVSDLITGYHYLLDILTMFRNGWFITGQTSIFDSYVAILEAYLNQCVFPQALYDSYVKQVGFVRLPNTHNRIRLVADLPYLVKAGAQTPSTYMQDIDALAVLIGNAAITMQNDGIMRKVLNCLKRSMTTLKVVPIGVQPIHEVSTPQGNFLLDRLFNRVYYHSSAAGFTGSGIDPVAASLNEAIPYWSITGNKISDNIADVTAIYHTGSRLEHGQTTLIERSEVAGWNEDFYINEIRTGMVFQTALAAEEGYTALIPCGRETTSNDKSTGDFATFQRSVMSPYQLMEISLNHTIRDVRKSMS